MIDLHTHILCALDDGAANLDESVEMARIAAADGVEVVVATPHADGAFAARRGLVDERLDEFRRALGTAGLSIEVRLGCEAYLEPRSPALAAAGALPSLNASRYLLVELPLTVYPPYAPQALFELRLKGLVPVLAHVERYRAVQADVNMLVGLIERGALAQVTGRSLLGGFGPEARRAAEIALEHDLAHVLASDAHSAAGRPPELAAARERAARLVGAARARSLVVDVPRAVLEDRAVEVPAPRPYRRRPFWAFGR